MPCSHKYLSLTFQIAATEELLPLPASSSSNGPPHHMQLNTHLSFCEQSQSIFPFIVTANKNRLSTAAEWCHVTRCWWP